MRKNSFTQHEDGYDVPEGDAAVVFHADGSLSLIIPKRDDDEQVPEYIMAATEVLFETSEEELSDIAQRFHERVKGVGLGEGLEEVPHRRH